jgi:hypothetical protein
MKDEIIKKYVKDLDGLLKEVTLMEEVNAYNWQGKKEEMVIFLFGRLFRFLKFDSVTIGHDPHEKSFDAIAYTQESEEVRKIIIEFEVWSSNFKWEHETEPNQRVLIVCWEDDWKECPSNLEVFDLEPLWRQAQEKV